MSCSQLPTHRLRHDAVNFRTVGFVGPVHLVYVHRKTRFTRVTPSLLSSVTRSEGKAGAFCLIVLCFCSGNGTCATCYSTFCDVIRTMEIFMHRPNGRSLVDCFCSAQDGPFWAHTRADIRSVETDATMLHSHGVRYSHYLRCLRISIFHFMHITRNRILPK